MLGTVDGTGHLVLFLSYFVLAEKRGLCYPNYCVCLGKPVGTWWAGEPVYPPFFGLCGPYSSGEYFFSLFYYFNVNKLISFQ